MKTRLYVLPLLLLLVFGFAGTAGAASGSASPVIDAFYVDPSNQVAAGTELTFTVEGTPKGQASVKVSGVQKTIPLKEVSRGSYEGSYTIKSSDRPGTNPSARATLRVRDRATTSVLALAAGAGAAAAAAAPAAPAAAPAAPATAGPPKIERFTMAPIAKPEPGSDLRFSMSGTPGAKASFSIEGVVRDAPMREFKSGEYGGRYTIRQRDNLQSTVNAVGKLESAGQSVTARLNQALTAQPGTAQPPAGAAAPAAAAGLPLQITSHTNNEQIKGGATEVRGRTAPGAKVDVQVNAGLLGINQQIASQSVVADASGNFAFSFKPPVSVPGARYDITIKAAGKEGTKDMQLSLVQQR